MRKTLDLFLDMKKNLDCNVKTTTPSMYNNVKQGKYRLNIY